MKENKTVLHLRSSGGLLGAENVILEISKNSMEFGIRPIIGAIKYIKDPIPEFINIGKKLNFQTVVFNHKLNFDLICAAKIRKYIQKEGINVLHCHGYKEDFYAILSRTKIPKIATNHLWKKTNKKLKCYRLIDIVLLRFFNIVVGVSEALVQEMKNYGIKNVSKITNGIDTKKFTIQRKSQKILEELKLPKNKIILGMISSLTPEKNHHIVIDSLWRMKKSNLVLLVVGSGPLEILLKKTVRKKGLERQVIFAGKRDNVSEILSVIDIFLLPSFDEGLPMSLLEAMACGKAVIASKVGENENVISHEENGMLISSGNILELMESLNKIIDYPKLKLELGEKARQTVVAHYSSNMMAQKYCDKYKALLQKGGK